MRIERAYVPKAGGEFTGTVLFADGAAATPSLAFASAPTYGLYFASNRIRVAVGGLEVYQFTSTGVLINQSAALMIRDPNDNEVLKFSAVASAVNEVTIANAATGNAPAISATGGDTDIDLALTPKGAGLVQFGTHSAIGAESVTGYITIKDAGGTSRKIAVVS